MDDTIRVPKAIKDCNGFMKWLSFLLIDTDYYNRNNNYNIVYHIDKDWMKCIEKNELQLYNLIKYEDDYDWDQNVRTIHVQKSDSNQIYLHPRKFNRDFNIKNKWIE